MANDIIQVNYEDLDEIARRFTQQADDTERLQQQIQGRYSVLENGGWAGQGANAFFAEMESELFPALKRLQDALESGKITTQEIIQLFQAAEEEASGSLDVGDTKEGFSTSKFIKEVIPNGADKFLRLTDLLTYRQFRAIGRFINAYILDNARGGWVGKMDGLGHILRSDLVKDGVPLGLGILFDEDLTTDPSRAIAGEVISFGLSKVATRFIPGAGWVLLGSDVVQLGGHGVAFVADAMGYSGTATWIQNNLDTIDLGGYVEDLSEGIFDTGRNWVADPSRITTDVAAAGDWLVDFGGGLIDDGSDLAGSIWDGIDSMF
ncbi:MAG: WXG100 family type VII secretion target [Ardenticatenaceae bacterium]|nr:WXG100 family type VII secretion target [Anaerolineales bacterium]MCB8921181.1 WXG100 family type VII secretion target [Ardenticatenaceae bacterium]MCB8990883.1 WXG100 family type VII secretion target [Ardenticatenaceae bacterium]